MLLPLSTGPFFFFFFCLFVCCFCFLFCFSVFALASTEWQKHTHVFVLCVPHLSQVYCLNVFVLSRAQVFVFVLFLLFSSPFFALACLFVLFICWLDGLTKVGVWVVFLPISRPMLLW